SCFAVAWGVFKSEMRASGRAPAVFRTGQFNSVTPERLVIDLITVVPGTPLTAVNLSKFWSFGLAARTQRGRDLMVEPAAGEAEQALRHEDDHGDKDEANQDEIIFREEA